MFHAPFLSSPRITFWEKSFLVFLRVVLIVLPISALFHFGALLDFLAQNKVWASLVHAAMMLVDSFLFRLMLRDLRDLRIRLLKKLSGVIHP